VWTKGAKVYSASGNWLVAFPHLAERAAAAAVVDASVGIGSVNAVDAPQASLRATGNIDAVGSTVSPRGARDREERVGEQRVATMDQVALAAQEAIDAVGQIASDLLDPRVGRMADPVVAPDAIEVACDQSNTVQRSSGRSTPNAAAGTTSPKVQVVQPVASENAWQATGA
jgi:hypothetical protein